VKLQDNDDYQRTGMDYSLAASVSANQFLQNIDIKS